jgi:hypothetical protein
LAADYRRAMGKTLPLTGEIAIMDKNYEPLEIYCADRSAVAKALENKAPNKRGAMTVAQFKIIAQLVWTPES